MLRPALGVLTLALGFVVAAVLAGVGGCSSASTNPFVAPSVSPAPSVSVAPTPTPTPTPMNNISVLYQASPTPNSTFGALDGYGTMAGPPVNVTSPSPIPPTAAPQGLISVGVGQTIVFYNFDSRIRTVSLLGPANGTNWPTFFNATGCVNSIGCSSPEGSAITLTGFSANIPGKAGAVPGQSLGYVTGSATGSFYYADVTDYCPKGGAEPCGNAASPDPSMRTVITIHP
jgi:hypothetical protein